ncbi:MAG: NAD(P)/FAD-dependent oxidoreductase [Pyrinomonadaceae bacterium]
MTAHNFDIMIVGAGPAGSLAAERLAAAGRSVALFDGRPPGDPKACGGGVTSKALKAWPFLLEATGRVIHDLEMYSPVGKRLNMKLEEPFAIYSRSTFDGYLRDRARNAGAQVIPGRVSFTPRAEGETLWTLRSSDGTTFSAPMLVAADGANSRIAKLLSGPLANSEMEVAFGYRAPLPRNGQAPTVIAFLPGWAGYAWSFPRPDHISFGIATTQDAFDHAALDKMMWDFMVGYYRQREDPNVNLWKRNGNRDAADHAITIELKQTAERYAARIPGLTPETWDTRKASGPGWALLGDAAGFADPVTGEGIYYALRSAELFAECYLADQPENYEARWRQDFGAELRRAAQMRRKFYGPFMGAAFTDRMIQFARIHPGIRKVLGELVAGEQGYVDLKPTLARRALWPF